MSESYDKTVRQLNSEISDNLDRIESFLEFFKTNKESPNYSLLEFQELMDILTPIKSRADQLTAHYDHA